MSRKAWLRISPPRKETEWDRRIDRYLWPSIWLLWLLSGLGLEIYALWDKDLGDTLSEQVWGLLEYLSQWGSAGQFATVVFVIGVIGFFGWLVLHFFGRRKV